MNSLRRRVLTFQFFHLLLPLGDLDGARPGSRWASNANNREGLRRNRRTVGSISIDPARPATVVDSIARSNNLLDRRGPQ
jgi:hypothetical protein